MNRFQNKNKIFSSGTSAGNNDGTFALLFDCDGVIVEVYKYKLTNNIQYMFTCTIISLFHFISFLISHLDGRTPQTR